MLNYYNTEDDYEYNAEVLYFFLSDAVLCNVSMFMSIW